MSCIGLEAGVLFDTTLGEAIRTIGRHPSYTINLYRDNRLIVVLIGILFFEGRGPDLSMPHKRPASILDMGTG